MDSKPLVSIITPCYNSEAYLSRYLDSVLAQTYTNVQQIVVNDGSSDRTERIALEYRNRFESSGMIFTYVKQQNQGLGAAINTGLKEVKGEYFTWCDSDNFYSDEYIEEKIYFFLNNPKYSIVRCDGKIVKDNDITEVVGTMAGDSIIDKTSENLFINCLLIQDFHFGCAMLRTSDFDKVVVNREIYPSRLGQNWQLLLPMFYHYKSGYIDKPMFFFVERADSISHSVESLNYTKKVEQLLGHLDIIENTILNMHVNEEAEYLAKVRSKYYSLILSVLFEASDKREFKKYYLLLKKNGTVTKETRDSYYELCYPLWYKIMNRFNR